MHSAGTGTSHKVSSLQIHDRTQTVQTQLTCSDTVVGFETQANESVCVTRAALGIEPRTSRTRSENHTTRPSSRLMMRKGVRRPVVSRTLLTNMTDAAHVCDLAVVASIPRATTASTTLAKNHRVVTIRQFSSDILLKRYSGQ